MKCVQEAKAKHKQLRVAFLYHSTSPLHLQSCLNTAHQVERLCQLTESWMGLPFHSPQPFYRVALTESFPLHTRLHASSHLILTTPVGRLSPPWSLALQPVLLGVPRTQGPDHPLPRPFHRVVLQRATLRDAIMSPSGTKGSLAHCLP